MNSYRLIAAFVVVSSLIACESSHKQSPVVGAGSATVAEVPSPTQVGGHGGETVGAAGITGAGGVSGNK